MNDTTRLRIHPEGGPAFDTTWGAFAADNAEDAGLLVDVAEQAAGVACWYGGGAAPLVSITVLG